MSFINTYFEYDNISSEEMGVILIRTEGGMIGSSFGYSQSPIVETLKGRDKLYHFGIETSPLKFTITIGTINNEPWTKEKRMKIAKWLFQKQYKPFVSGDNLDVVYYCMVDGIADRFDNSIGEGYVTIPFVCNSPYAYSPTYVNTYYYSSSATDVITLTNYSNVLKYYYPEVEITMTDDIDVSIINLSNGGEEFKFSNLEVGEIIYINNQSKQIISNIEEKSRLNNFNKKWLRLVEGENRLKITGNVDIVFKSTFPIAL